MILNQNIHERNDYPNLEDDRLKGGTGEAGTSDADDEEVLKNGNGNIDDLDLDADMAEGDLDLDEEETE